MMQDSLEDFIKLSKNTRQDDPVNFSKEVEVTAQQKKECEDRAMKIVEFSIEGKLRPEIFTKCLPFINQSHYQDIVEERSITKLCGYSICGKRIPEMPKKQYYISTKNNKVYDITDRKNYCSNFCYKASLHIKNQIDNSPLWLRKLEDIPEYQLLGSTEGGLPGELIDQGIVKPPDEPAFTSVSIFTQASLNEMLENEKGKEKVNKVKGPYRKSSKLKSTMQTIKENSEQVEEEEPEVEKNLNHKNKKGSKKLEHSTSLKILPVIEENEEKAEISNEVNENIKENSGSSSKVITKKTKKKTAKTQKLDVESLIHKYLKEWITLESYIFIYGEAKIKEILNEKKLGDYFDELNITELQRDQQIKYLNICKRLQLQEIADEKFDNALIGNNKLKPIPDYKKLKVENKDLTVKVKCFYGGVLHKKEDTNFPTKVNKSEETNQDEGRPPAILPLVDVNSQNALRRKIFLTSINKSMQQLFKMLRVSHFTSVLSDLQTLVKTFNLKADNIIFKPFIWNYIAVILLNILALKDSNIRNILDERESKEFIELQFSTLPNKEKFISDIMVNIQNIELFIENYISSK